MANHENRHQKSQHLGRIESAKHALHTAWNGISSIFTSNKHKEKCICAFGISFRCETHGPGQSGPTTRPEPSGLPRTNQQSLHLDFRFPCEQIAKSPHYLDTGLCFPCEHHDIADPLAVSHRSHGATGGSHGISTSTHFRFKFRVHWQRQVSGRSRSCGARRSPSAHQVATCQCAAQAFHTS